MIKRYFIPLSFLLIALFVSVMILLLHTKNNANVVNQHTPNIYMKQASYYNYDKQGELTSIIQTPMSSYNTKSQHIEMNKPQIKTYDQNKITWVITADHGFTQKSNTMIDLQGHVVFRQLSQTDEPDTIITTSKATLLPKKSLAKTQQPITIQHGKSLIKGVGMNADLKKNNFNLIQQSNGSFGSSDDKKTTN